MDRLSAQYFSSSVVTSARFERRTMAVGEDWGKRCNPGHYTSRTNGIESRLGHLRIAGARFHSASGSRRVGEAAARSRLPLRLVSVGYIYVLDVNDDERPDLVTSMAHDYGFFWMENLGGGKWAKHMIDDT